MERVYVEALRGDVSLKKSGVDINIKSTGGYISLILASKNGLEKVVEFLVDY